MESETEKLINRHVPAKAFSTSGSEGLILGEVVKQEEGELSKLLYLVCKTKQYFGSGVRPVHK